MTRCSVNIAVQYFIILWRLPALESPEQFGKRRGGNASANRGNQIPARISITTRSLCASISSQNRTLFTSTPIIRSRRTPQLLAASSGFKQQDGNHVSDVSFCVKEFSGRRRQSASAVHNMEVRQFPCVKIVKKDLAKNVQIL